MNLGERFFPVRFVMLEFPESSEAVSLEAVMEERLQEERLSNENSLTHSAVVRLLLDYTAAISQ